MADEYRRGQVMAFEVAMTVLCPHCHRDFYGPAAENNIVRDVKWWRGELRSAHHDVNGKRRVCRAAKLIPFILIFHPDSPRHG